MSYGQKLKAWRKAQRLTQEQLGKKIGFSDKFVSQHEREAGQLSRNFLQKSAELMGISYEELVSAEGRSDLLNECVTGESKAVVHPVEIQQFQIALEVVLEKLNEDQLELLTKEALRAGGPDPRLNLAVRQLIMAAILKLGSNLKKQSIPKN